jgi:hypothetical protein
MEVLKYVRELFQSRLDQHECLVVYDPSERYRQAAEALEGERRTFISGDDGTIKGRERAMDIWRKMGSGSVGDHQLLIYLPIEKPGQDERLHDPYTPFWVGGSIFPSSDADSYLELCLRAKSNHAEQIRALFEEADDPTGPDLATVEAVEGAASWPRLRTVLGVESDREIVRSLLSPSKKQQREITTNDLWRSEYVNFAGNVLGFEPVEISDSLQVLQSELARFVLFSEFVLDLPDRKSLPASLSEVPRAHASIKRLIRGVCEDLRTSKRHEEQYKFLARIVVDDLNLKAQTESIDDFGVLDTFPFQERAFLTAFVKAIEDGQREEARSIIAGRQSSIWAYSEERGSDWVLAERLVDLLDAIDDQEMAFDAVGGELTDLVEYYVSDGRQVDTSHRTLEQTIQEKYWQTGLLGKVVAVARKRYRAFADRLQRAFIERVDNEGWPPTRLPRQTHVFGRTVSPSLAEHGRRVAYVMVDAFRYELAAAFADRLSNEFRTTIQAASAVMPTVTRVGMAALLPGAENNLYLDVRGGSIVPQIDGADVIDPAGRLKHLQKTYGDRCAMADLDAVLQGNVDIADTTQLLLVKTREIDIAGESMSNGIEVIVNSAQEKYLRAVSALGELGYEEVHFVTDHGFLLLSEQEPGDGVDKPPGSWRVKKERSLLGTGSASNTTAVYRTDELGINGNFDHVAVPRMLGAFRLGSTYMHSGLSLQESVVPVLSVQTVMSHQTVEGVGVQLRLSYRGKRDGRVTTRRPMIEIEAGKSNMFGENELEFRLEARSDGKIVGQAASSGDVDPSTNLVKVDFSSSHGASTKVPMSLKEDFRGSFEVVAVNPITQVRFDAITLKTDYLE